MIQLISALLLTALVGRATFAYEDIKMGDLPVEIAEELEYMLKASFIELKPNCTETTKPDVRFYLYTRSNPDNPVLLDPNNPQGIDVRRKNVFLLHGWLSKSTSRGMSNLRDAYLKRYDCNLITIDWSASAWQLYTSSFCDVMSIATSISDFLCVLAEKLSLRLTLVHLVGHSMGGQIAGFVGQYVNTKCAQKLGRITGLDPSGPLFEHKQESQRLDKSDAEFVDVIHTDGMKFGHWLTCGAVDFHPNCRGLKQLGCPDINVVDSNTSVQEILCSQHRSLELMTESVNSEDLIGVSCGICPRLCEADIINEVYSVMGENCRQIPKPAKNFLIPTNSAAPYGQGMDPYPMRINKNVLCRNAAQSPTPSLMYYNDCTKITRNLNC